MSTIKEKIAALLKPHGIKLAGEPVKMEAQGTAEDGTIIATPTAWEVDAEVYVMDSDGNPTPAPDGDYVVDGAVKITVADGKITEVSAVEAEMSAEITEVINNLAERIAALESANTQATTELSAVKEKLSAAEAQAAKDKAEIARLKALPAAKSVKEKKDPEKKAAPAAQMSNQAQKSAAQKAVDAFVKLKKAS